MQSIALYSWSIYVGGQVTAPMQQAACLLRQLVCVIPVERVRQIYVVLRVCVWTTSVGPQTSHKNAVKLYFLTSNLFI